MSAVAWFSDKAPVTEGKPTKTPKDQTHQPKGCDLDEVRE
jgi:hypothetical protein